jgi:hypothetical protein
MSYPSDLYQIHLISNLSVVNTISVSCLVYPVSLITFGALISNPSAFNALTHGSAPLRAELIFNPSGRATYGGFKRAAFGHSNVPIFGDSTHVCIKQCWYQCKASGDRLLYDNPTQVVKLSSEINCLRWASALMELVYDFISEATASCGTPPFEIPRMRFVKSALAVAKNDIHDTYMIEEVIDVSVDGKFVKYIGNSSAVINKFQDKSLQDKAEFLAFCQHVQYNKTQELAFIGDYQGNRMHNSPVKITDLTRHCFDYRWTDSAHGSTNYHISVCISVPLLHSSHTYPMA